MRKVIFVALALSIMVGIAGVALPQDKPMYQVLMSNVMSISKDRLVLTPLKENEQPVAVTITKDTKCYDRDGRTEIGCHTFKKGDEITVTCLNDPTLSAVKARKGFHMEL